MIKARKGFILRRLGDEYMVVALGEASKSFNGMIRMNETGAFYWKELENGTSEDQLAARTRERFPDVDMDIACRDVQAFLQTIAIAIEHDASDD